MILTDADRASLSRPRVTVRQIIKEVATEIGVDPQVIYGRSRRAEDFRARALVCYIARRYGMSYPQIGRVLDRDHTTIRSAVLNEQRRRGEA